VPLEAVLQTK